MLQVERGHLRHLSFTEGILNQESISIVMGPKKLIVLPYLIPPEGYAETRRFGKGKRYYCYALAGKILEHFGNIPFVNLGLTKEGFADPSAFDRLSAAVNNGTFWQHMWNYFQSDNRGLGFLLPQFAYTIDAKPLSGYAAILKENRGLDKRLPVFRLA